MSGGLQGLKEYLRKIHDTAARTELLEAKLTHMEAQQTDLVEMLARLHNEGRGERNAEFHALRDAVGQVDAYAREIQRVSGETFGIVGEGRLHTLQQLDQTRLALGRIEARQLALSGCIDWNTNAFRVYSQFGEDGLLQLLIREVGIPPHLRSFVEFGVEDYREANTRFLLFKDRWRGLVLDGDPDNVAAIKERDSAYQWYGLAAEAAFITRDNIDSLMQRNGFSGEIGLLSIDIDGNDFWVWDAMTVLNPVLVSVEYNYRFGTEAAQVVPYDPAFVKTLAHPSAIYYGASLRALTRLASHKGYALVGCSDGGVNAFFVRRDRLPASLPERTVEEAYVPAYHVEMRNVDGVPIRADLAEQQQILFSLPLVSVDEEGRAESE